MFPGEWMLIDCVLVGVIILQVHWFGNSILKSFLSCLFKLRWKQPLNDTYSLEGVLPTIVSFKVVRHHWVMFHMSLLCCWPRLVSFHSGSLSQPWWAVVLRGTGADGDEWLAGTDHSLPHWAPEQVGVESCVQFNGLCCVLTANNLLMVNFVLPWTIPFSALKCKPCDVAVAVQRYAFEYMSRTCPCPNWGVAIFCGARACARRYVFMGVCAGVFMTRCVCVCVCVCVHACVSRCIHLLNTV